MVLIGGGIVRTSSAYHQRDEMVGVTAPLRHSYGPIVVLQSNDEVTLPLTFFEGGYYVCEESSRQLFAVKFATAYEEATTLDPDCSHAVTTR